MFFKLRMAAMVAACIKKKQSREGIFFGVQFRIFNQCRLQ